MLIGLASPRVATSLDDGLDKVRRSLADAAGRGAKVACFPEAYLPGLRGLDFDVPPFDPARQEHTLREVGRWAREYAIAAVLGMEWHSDSGRHIAAVVVDDRGEVQGVQTKNQLDPSEDPLYVPGTTRRLFDVGGLRFGVVICHEGFRYPETVRWAATRGAKVVFHQHCTGSDGAGVTLKEWASPAGPYYEKAILCRGLENTVYFASVNYAFRYQEAATCVISPAGECLARLPYGEEGVLVHDIWPEAATGLLASRYAPRRYEEFNGG
ncbi:MAG: carbon-nitrogen hydrolase family protein [Gemmataceae bacterium]